MSTSHIVGMGLQMLAIKSVQKWIDQGTPALISRFSVDELAYAEGKRRADEHLAGRWAAKLALFKATGWPEEDLALAPDISIVRLPSGAPEMQLSGVFLEKLASHEPYCLHLTISHSGDLAVAMVVVEHRPESIA